MNYTLQMQRGVDIILYKVTCEDGAVVTLGYSPQIDLAEWEVIRQKVWNYEMNLSKYEALGGELSYNWPK